MIPWTHVSQPPNGTSISSAIIAYTAAKSPNAFQWADTPKITPFPWGIGDHI